MDWSCLFAQCGHCHYVSSLCFAAITDIRLINGTFENQGRLEVQVYGLWGTVCHDSWGVQESNVACKQLGYSKALFAHSIILSDSNLPNWLERVHCNGSEEFIWDCDNNGIGPEDGCTGDEIVYLMCHTNTNGTGVCVSECIVYWL